MSTNKIFKDFLNWLGLKTKTLKKDVKERKASSRPTRVHKPKKGKGSYIRTKKVTING